MIIIIFSILVVLLLVGCEDKNNKEYCKTLFVDLDSIEADVNDVFSKIEIIPLETTDSSFVVYPKEIQIFEDIIYIYDIDRQKVFLLIWMENLYVISVEWVMDQANIRG